MSKGGQKRTAICPCGFVAKGQLREANFKIKMHAKRCPRAIECNVAEMVSPTFAPGPNGIHGIVRSRNGNMVHQPSIATGGTSEVAIGLTLSELLDLTGKK